AGGLFSCRLWIGRAVCWLLPGRGIWAVGIPSRHRASLAAIARTQSKLRGPIRLLHAESQAGDFRRIPPDLSGHGDRAPRRRRGGGGNPAAAGSTSLAIAAL